eukprot:6064993-Karenia_brevis.AAC.1
MPVGQSSGPYHMTHAKDGTPSQDRSMIQKLMSTSNKSPIPITNHIFFDTSASAQAYKAGAAQM